MLFLSCFAMLSYMSVHCCLVFTCWERADLLALIGDVYCIFVTFCTFVDFCRLYYFICSFIRCSVLYFLSP